MKLCASRARLLAPRKEIRYNKHIKGDSNETLKTR